MKKWFSGGIVKTPNTSCSARKPRTDPRGNRQSYEKIFIVQKERDVRLGQEIPFQELLRYES